MPVKKAIKTDLVLGGSGFIGLNLALRMSEAGLPITVASRNPGSTESIPNVEFIPFNFLKNSEMNDLLKNRRRVFHFISTTTPATSNLDVIADAESNLISTIRLLEACKNADVEKIVFLSSGGTVYGNQPQGKILETADKSPISAYGVSKIAIENYLKFYEQQHGLRSVALRLSNPYGPHQTGNSNHGVVATFIKRTLKNEPIEIWGDGRAIRDFVYIDDVVQAITVFAESDATGIYNVGSGVGASLLQLLSEISDITNREQEINFKPTRGLDVGSNVLDSSLAKSTTGWESTTSIRDGLEKTIDWWSRFLATS